MSKGSRRISAIADIIAAIAVLSSFAPPAIAQTQTATLVGSVSDTTGAVVPQVKVTVVNTETSFRSETLTNADGAYYVPYLSPGTYRIVLEASGFKRAVNEGVMMRAGETPRVDVTLEVGSFRRISRVEPSSKSISRRSFVWRTALTVRPAITPVSLWLLAISELLALHSPRAGV